METKFCSTDSQIAGMSVDDLMLPDLLAGKYVCRVCKEVSCGKVATICQHEVECWYALSQEAKHAKHQNLSEWKVCRLCQDMSFKRLSRLMEHQQANACLSPRLTNVVASPTVASTIDSTSNSNSNSSDAGGDSPALPSPPTQDNERKGKKRPVKRDGLSRKWKQRKHANESINQWICQKQGQGHIQVEPVDDHVHVLLNYSANTPKNAPSQEYYDRIQNKREPKSNARRAMVNEGKVFLTRIARTENIDKMVSHHDQCTFYERKTGNKWSIFFALYDEYVAAQGVLKGGGKADSFGMYHDDSDADDDYDDSDDDDDNDEDAAGAMVVAATKPHAAGSVKKSLKTSIVPTVKNVTLGTRLARAARSIPSFFFTSPGTKLLSCNGKELLVGELSVPGVTSPEKLWPMKATPEVFICHSSQDTKQILARPTYWFLTNVLHVDAFLDDCCLEPGQHIDRILKERAYRCTHALILLSPRFRTSPYCVRELNTFMSRVQKEEGFRLLPALWLLKDTQGFHPDIDDRVILKADTQDPFDYMVRFLWPALLKALNSESMSREDLEGFANQYFALKTPTEPSFPFFTNLPNSLPLLRGSGDANSDVPSCTAATDATQITTKSMQGSNEGEDPPQDSLFRYKSNVLARIRGCVTVHDFKALYHTEIVRNLHRIRSAQQGCTSVDEWAKTWAQALHKSDSKSIDLNFDRKVCLTFVYALCDCWNEGAGRQTVSSSDIDEVLGRGPIVDVLTACLPMDKANCLFNMTLPGHTKPGMHWVSKTHVETNDEWKVRMKNYEGFPTMNKRIIWLLNALNLADHPVMKAYTTPVVSPELD